MDLSQGCRSINACQRGCTGTVYLMIFSFRMTSLHSPDSYSSFYHTLPAPWTALMEQVALVCIHIRRSPAHYETGGKLFNIWLAIPAWWNLTARSMLIKHLNLLSEHPRYRLANDPISDSEAALRHYLSSTKRPTLTPGKHTVAVCNVEHVMTV